MVSPLMIGVATATGIGLLGVLGTSWVLSLKRIVPTKYADVVTRDSGVKIYSVDQQITKTPKQPQTSYYEFPWWIPRIGTTVVRMPLTIIEIPIRGYKTFAKGNARYVVDVSVYCKIVDVLEASKRFPGMSLTDFKEGIKELVIGAIRTTTANFTVEEVIANREQLAKKIEAEVKDDFFKWGVELTNVAIVDISDPDDKSSTIVHDISAKKEAEINATSRKEIAIKQREAEMIEAENREKAETRNIQADETIKVREQSKEQKVAIEQEKAKKQQMEVVRVQQVEQAKINADAKREEAEGTKEATVRIAEGTQRKFEMEGKGKAVAVQAEGSAEAEVIKRKGLAEAEALDKKAEAQKKQQAFAQAIREIEMEEKVRVELARAFQKADMKFINAGSPKTFMDLFSPEGGLSAGAGLGTFLTGLQETDPETYDGITKYLTKAGKSLFNRNKRSDESEEEKSS